MTGDNGVLRRRLNSPTRLRGEVGFLTDGEKTQLGLTGNTLGIEEKRDLHLGQRGAINLL